MSRLRENANAKLEQLSSLREEKEARRLEENEKRRKILDAGEAFWEEQEEISWLVWEVERRVKYT